MFDVAVLRYIFYRLRNIQHGPKADLQLAECVTKILEAFSVNRQGFTQLRRFLAQVAMTDCLAWG